MKLSIRPTMFLNNLEDAVKFEVDGLPRDLYAQIVRARGGDWRTQWGKNGDRLTSLALADTPEAAMQALEEALGQSVHRL